MAATFGLELVLPRELELFSSLFFGLPFGLQFGRPFGRPFGSPLAFFCSSGIFGSLFGPPFGPPSPRCFGAVCCYRKLIVITFCPKHKQVRLGSSTLLVLCLFLRAAAR